MYLVQEVNSPVLFVYHLEFVLIKTNFKLKKTWHTAKNIKLFIFLVFLSTIMFFSCGLSDFSECYDIYGKLMCCDT